MPLRRSASCTSISVPANWSGIVLDSLIVNLSLSSWTCFAFFDIVISNSRLEHFSGDRYFNCLLSHCWDTLSSKSWLGSNCLSMTTPDKRARRFLSLASRSTAGNFLVNGFAQLRQRKCMRLKQESLQDRYVAQGR